MSMSERQSHPRRRVGAYGIDAPYVPVIFGVGGLVLLGIAGLNAAQGINPWAIITCALSGVWFLACAACYLHTTRAGKFAVWAEIIQGLQLRGAERVLDLGCGRGAVLLAIAKRLPHGQAIGIDLWKISDQSGNSMAMTRRNAVREGVATQVTLETADMRAPLRGRRVRCRGQQPGDPHHPRRGRAGAGGGGGGAGPQAGRPLGHHRHPSCGAVPRRVATGRRDDAPAGLALLVWRPLDGGTARDGHQAVVTRPRQGALNPFQS